MSLVINSVMRILGPQLPAITDATVTTVNHYNSVRCINDQFLVDEQTAIGILEFAARVCYKSDRQNDADPMNLIRMLYNKGHLSVFEHVNYHFLVDLRSKQRLLDILHSMERVDKFLIHRTDPVIDSDYDFVVTCNLRSLSELYQFTEYVNDNDKHLINAILASMRYVWPKLYDVITSGDIADCNASLAAPLVTPNGIPIMYRHAATRYVFHVICTRAIANQIVRHRTLSFSQESTRFINYTKKSNTDLCVYLSEACQNNQLYYDALRRVADSSMLEYGTLIESGVKPEDARDMLPLGMKTELVISSMYRPHVPKFLYDGFARFFYLRHNAQPAIAEISAKIASLIRKAEKENI